MTWACGAGVAAMDDLPLVMTWACGAGVAAMDDLPLIMTCIEYLGRSSE